MIAKPSLQRNFAVRSLAAVVLGLSLIGTAAAENRPFSSWFKYASEIDATWEVAGDPAKPTVVSIRRKAADKQAADTRNVTRRVLVLYPRSSPAYDIAITKILSVFDSKEVNADFTVINFELNQARGRETLQFAEKNKYDLIFAMGSESTAWLYDNYRGGAIPVVSVCSKDPVELGQMKDYESGSNINFAFTSLNMPVEVQLAYVMEFKPGLKNLAILVDSKNVSAVQTQAEPIAARARKQGINVFMGTVQNPAKSAEELAQIVPDAVRTMQKNDFDLSNSVFLITGSTTVFREIRTINEKAGRVPVVSMIPEIVTAGRDTAVLAVGISFESNAHLAAVYGTDILRGRAQTGKLKVGIVSPPDIAVSFLKAREIGLRVPFSFFETATFVYDYDGHPVRTTGRKTN
jgi:putative tryptophan/tyrosine transport system substrate-binding protein